MSKKHSIFILYSAFILPMTTVQAQSFDPATEDIYIHPFQDDPYLPEDSFDELGLSEHSFSSKIVDFLSEKINRPDITIKVGSNSGLNLAETFPDSETLTLNFEKSGIPICLAQVKAMKIAGTLTLFGEIPKIDESNEFPLPDLSLSLNKAWASLKQKSPLLHGKILYSQICLFAADKTLKPVWQMTLKNGPLKYKVWADEQKVYKLSKLFFDMNSTNIQAYARDPVSTPTLKLFKEDVNSDTLANSLFITDTSPDESGIKRAKADEKGFVFETDNPLFEEASLFVHVNEHYAFFKSLGYQWSSSRPLIVKFHTHMGDSQNNAFYQPPDSSSSPLIVIGDGDGTILKNLVSDADVVSHEFGHHIIFRNIKESSGESLLLHEGIADYFVFAKTGDPCLGRSICVPGIQGICAVQDQCLRVASTTLQYQSEEYKNDDSHLKSQLVSGFLYGLHDVIGPKIVPQMVYNALSLLVSNSGLKHLVIAMMLTDYQMNKGVNACKIYNAAADRGLSSLLSDVDCTKLDSLSLTSATQVSKRISSKKKKSRFLGCSGFAKVPAENYDVTMFFIFIPIAVRRKFRRKQSGSLH